MPKLIFATVGTSAIENCIINLKEKSAEMTMLDAAAKYFEKESQAEADFLNEKPTSDEKRDISLADAQNMSIFYNLNANLKNFEDSIRGSNMIQASRSVSAEVSSLLVMSKEPMVGEFGETDEIYLLPSDTHIGLVCAKANQMVLQKRFPKARIEYTEPLKGVRFTGSPGEDVGALFRNEGIQQLKNIVKAKVDKFQDNYGSSPRTALRIMDVTGGFKALILYAPVLCQEKFLHRIYYFYQEAEKPLYFDGIHFLPEPYVKNDQADYNLPPEKNQ